MKQIKPKRLPTKDRKTNFNLIKTKEMNWKSLQKLTLMAVLSVMFAFVSCDKDEDNGTSDTGTVSFNAMLNEVLSRQQNPGDELPDCSDAAPAYVDVVVTGPRNIGSVAAPYRVDLVNDGGSYITAENEEMTNIPAGDYQLISFIVYDAENNPIWIAPTAGNFEDFVPNPLPLDFTVEAGVDTVVTVDVLCFDNRILNEFGNLFFVLNPHMAIKFCIVGNTCGAGDASFSASIWLGSDNTGSVLYQDFANTPGEALCVALPDLDGEDQYYFEISMDATVIRSGAITDADVKALFDGDSNLDPYIFYEGDACTTADSPDLFAAGGGDTGGGGGTGMSFTIPYSETFESATVDSDLSDFGYATENTASATISEPGSTSLTQNTFPTVDDVDVTTDTGWGLQYGYVYRVDQPTTSAGMVDQVVLSSEFQASAGDYTLTYDISEVKTIAGHSVTVYYSEDTDGSFSTGNWNSIDTVTSTTDFDRNEVTFSVSGNFYVAFRIQADIPMTDRDGTRWRLDNINVDVASGGGTGGGTGGTFNDYLENFDDFDAGATYDPSYLESKGFEKYQLNSFAENNNINFEAETNGNYPSPGNGFQFTYFAETDAATPAGADRFGDFDAVMVSPGQANADGDFTVNIDARRYFSETVGTVTWYWTNNYNPGDGFIEANWNSLGTDNAQDLNDSGNFLTKSLNVAASSGTLYFAIRVEGSIDNGGTDATAQDGNYRFRVRFDNLQITQN